MTEPRAPIESVPLVADVHVVRGAAARPGAAPDLLIEIPHGATRAVHFDSLRGEFASPCAEDLRDFFFVNTDVGAPEAGAALARRFVAARPHATAAVIRCVLPRTFVDCNRVIDPGARPAASAAGDVTPGLGPWIRDADDVRMLLGRYAAYRDLVTRAVDATCAAGGSVLMLHTYAPRSIDVAVDEGIVAALRREYAPDRIGAWPLRAEVDLITRDPAGTLLADARLVASMQAACDAAGLGHAECGAYALHPVTLAATFAAKWPGRTLCVEIRRDLLAAEFTPFAEMEIAPEKAERIAGVLLAGYTGAGV